MSSAAWAFAARPAAGPPAEPIQPDAPVTKTRMSTLPTADVSDRHQFSTLMSATVITYYRAMGRWEPDARGRLAQAALTLYVQQGFGQTTVAEIARRAGLTERTFFRHFADKREVLFWGAGALEELVVKAVADAPASLSPIDAVAAALEAAGALLQERRQFARLRQRVIAANAELR